MAKQQQRANAKKTQASIRRRMHISRMKPTRREREERRDLIHLCHDREDIFQLHVDLSSNVRRPAYIVTFTNPVQEVALFRSELVRLVGPQVVVFLEASSNLKLSATTMFHLGLTESTGDRVDYDLRTPGDSWNMQSVVWDKDEGCFFGVDEEDGREWPILLYTLCFDTNSTPRCHEVTDDSHFVFGSQSRVAAALQIVAWCCRMGRHRRRLLLTHSRSREPSSVTPRYREPRWGEVRFRDGYDLCIQAAICNGLELLDFRSPSTYWEYFRRMAHRFERHGRLPWRIRDFRDAQKHLLQWHVTLRHVSHTHVLSAAEVVGLDPGVYVVTLEGTRGVVHSLAVDTKNKIIIDCAEPFPLTLCERALTACVGGRSEFIRIREIRRVHLPEKPGRSKKARHRNDGNNKKKRRRLAIEREANQQVGTA